jgi:hypothetical protein
MRFDNAAADSAAVSLGMSSALLTPSEQCPVVELLKQRFIHFSVHLFRFGHQPQIQIHARCESPSEGERAFGISSHLSPLERCWLAALL